MSLRTIAGAGADPPDEDPRDIPLGNSAAVVRWALQHGIWDGYERRILSALWLSNSRQVAQTLRIAQADVEFLLLRARRQVQFAARARDRQDAFVASRVFPVRHRPWRRMADVMLRFATSTAARERREV